MGRPEADDPRIYAAMVRLTASEWQVMERERGQMSRSEWLRTEALKGKVR